MQSLRTSLTATGLAIVGLGAWLLSSFLTPYITSPEVASCTVHANEATSWTGWGVGLFAIATALAVQRGSVGSSRAVVVTGVALLVAFVAATGWIAYAQSSYC